MHNSTSDISDEVIQKLNDSANRVQINKFRETFNSLSNDHKQCYLNITTLNGHAMAMSFILVVVAKDQAVSTFRDLLEKNQGFVFKVLSNIAGHYSTILFKALFGRLNQYKEEHIKHVIEKQKSLSAIFSILNAMEEQEAVSTFHDLLERNQDFAFSVLRKISTHKLALFKTLSNELDSQQKEDYKVYLETKVTARVRFIPRNFYSNNKEGSSKLRTENSNTDSLGNESLAQKRKRSFQDKFSTLNNSINFLSNSAPLEETADQYGLNPRSVVPKSTLMGNCIVDLENQSCGELISWVNGEQPSSSLQLSILEKFDRLDELEEIHIEPVAKRQHIL